MNGARPLIDPFDRRVRDLRISVTDRCNFRCTYCMPAEGMTWMPREEVLSFEEIERVARICVERFGFDGIRLTGGEPTVRAQLPLLVARLAALGVDLAMTTNGSSFRLVADDLRQAGLRRVNISLDSLIPERFLAMTKRDVLPAVLDGIDAAIAAGFAQVKVNVVLVRGVNDDEALAFAEFGRARGVGVRFIEFMPLDAQGEWTLEHVVPADETLALIAARHDLEPIAQGAEPATRYRYLDGAGEVGFIASVTKPFCGSCDRVRLTADGQFRTCLFTVDEVDVRAVLRSGGTDDDVADTIERAVGTKWAGHSIGSVAFVKPRRGMSQIGG